MKLKFLFAKHSPECHSINTDQKLCTQTYSNCEQKKKFFNYYLSLMQHKKIKQPKDLFLNVRIYTDILTHKLLYEYHILL